PVPAPPPQPAIPLSHGRASIRPVNPFPAMSKLDPDVIALLERIAAALERSAPAPAPPFDASAADAFVWQPAPPRLHPVPRVNRVALPLLKGIDRVRD